MYGSYDVFLFDEKGERITSWNATSKKQARQELRDPRNKHAAKVIVTDANTKKVIMERPRGASKGIDLYPPIKYVSYDVNRGKDLTPEQAIAIIRKKMGFSEQLRAAVEEG